MYKINRKIYRFAEFEVNTVKRIILRQGLPVKLNDKAFDLLVFLIANNGNIIGKDEILGNVWEGSLIEENNLTVQISKIRKIFNETKDNPGFLKTITGRGYCFNADIAEIEDSPNNFTVPTDNSNVNDISRNKLTDIPKINKRLPVIIAALIIAVCLGLIFWLFGGKKNLPFQHIKPEPLTSSSKIENVAISPDGKYFAFVQSEAKGQSIWVQQTIFSNPILIIPPSDLKYWGIVFSPDGNKIYYSAFAENNPDLILYQVPTLGGKPEKIINDVGGAVSFSPNGENFAYITSVASNQKTFLKVSKSDGSAVKILSERNSSTGFKISGKAISWSPEGNLIAAVVKEIDETGEKEQIIGINPQNGQAQNITDKYWAKIKDVVWLMDGNGIVITANEKPSAPLQVWFISYPDGQVNQITDDLESYQNIGVATDNSIIAVKTNQIGNLSIANEADYADYIENADSIADQSGTFKDFVWMSENKLAFISKNDVWEINSDGSEKKQLTQDAQIRQTIDFSLNGNYFVFDSLRSGKTNLWRTGADGSNIRRITSGDGESYPSVSNDGSFIAYQNGVTNGIAGIRRINSDGSNLKEISPNSGMRPQISPDGKLVAFFFMDDISETEERWKIGIISIETGEIVRKIELPPTTVQRFLRWTNNGEAIAYIDDKGNESSIIIQPLNQSKPFAKFKTTAGKIESFAWSPDRKKLAVNSSIEIREAVLIKDK